MLQWLDRTLSGTNKVGFPGGSVVKYPPATWETRLWSLGQEDLLKKEMATHASILAWRIPRTESLGLQRVRHDWGINTSTSSGANSKNQLCVSKISFNFILLDCSTNVSCPLSFPNTLQTPLELRAHGFCMQHGRRQVLKNWMIHGCVGQLQTPHQFNASHGFHSKTSKV